MIAYYVPTVGVCYEIWQWNPAGPTFVYSSGAVIQAVSASGVHIDASYYGEFAIVWDNTSNGHILIESGTTGTISPSLSGNIVDVSSATGKTGKQPDVALHNDVPRAGGGSYDLVNITWVNSTNTVIYTGQESRGTVQSGSWGGTNFSNTYTAAGVNVYNPRIAAASDYDQGAGGWDVTDEMTVVFEAYRSSGPTYDIIGISGSYPSFATTNTFTINLFGIATINNSQNQYPVAVYDQVNGSVIVSWISSYSDPAFTPNAPCAIEMDGPWAGAPYGLASSCTLFMTVPQSNSGGETPVALAGKHGKSDPFYCWFDVNATTNFVTYKSVPSGSSSLREGAISSLQYLIYPNPFHDYLNIQMINKPFKRDKQLEIVVSNCFGQTVFEETADQEQLNVILQKLTYKLQNGTYLLKIIDVSGKHLIRSPIVKM